MEGQEEVKPLSMERLEPGYRETKLLALEAGAMIPAR